MKKTLYFYLVLSVFFFSLSGCNKSESPEVKIETDKALINLRKLDSSGELNQSLPEYRSLLVEAKAEIENSLVKIPEGDLKKEIQTGLEVYLFKLKAFEKKFEPPLVYQDGQDVIEFNRKDPTDARYIDLLLNKYKIRLDGEKNDEVSFWVKEVMPAIQKEGREHIDRATALITK